MKKLILLLALIPSTSFGWTFTLTGPGITYHGTMSEQDQQNLKNKVADRTVVHPIEFGGVIKTEHFQFAADYLHDCLGNPAGALLLGPKVDFFRYFSFGAVAGGYIRQHTESSSFPLSAKVGNTDVMPVIGVTGSVDIPINKTFSIETNILGGYVIDHANIGLKIKF